MSDAVLLDVDMPPTRYLAIAGAHSSPPSTPGRRSPTSGRRSPPPRFDARTLNPVRVHPFRQQVLWSLCAFLFSSYLATVLYLFLRSPSFRAFVVTRANVLFALPYVLSLLVVLLCVAPLSPTSARAQLDPAITSAADCCLVLLVLLEWATCLALVLVTLISVHDGLTYVAPDGLIVPVPVAGKIPPDAKPADGIASDAFVVLFIPILFMYTLFNFLVHLYSCIEAYFRQPQDQRDVNPV